MRDELRCDVCLGRFLDSDLILYHTCGGCEQVVVVHDGLCDVLLHQREPSLGLSCDG